MLHLDVEGFIIPQHPKIVKDDDNLISVYIYLKKQSKQNAVTLCL